MSSFLLKEKRFLPLLLTKISAAFNDNFFKNALIFAVLYGILQLETLQPEILITISAGLLVLPFLLFSACAGQMADKYQKEKMIRILKGSEIVIVVLAIIGLSIQSITVLLLALFLFGTQTAFLNPCVYALLPEHLKKNELVSGNGFLSAGTFLSILAGMIAGGMIITIPVAGIYYTMGVMALTALIGYGVSRKIPEAATGDQGLRINWNIPAEMYHNLTYVLSQPKDITLSILGIAWFYFVGGTYLAQFPIYAKEYLYVDEAVLMGGLVLFSLGIAIGSLINSKLLKGRIAAIYVPYAGIGIAVFSFIVSHMSTVEFAQTGDELLGFETFFQSINAYVIYGALFLVAVCGGLFVVPLNAMIQHKTEQEHRARIMASSGIVNAAFIVGSSLICLLVFKLGFGVEDIFLLVSLMSVVATFYMRQLARMDKV